MKPTDNLYFLLKILKKFKHKKLHFVIPGNYITKKLKFKSSFKYFNC